MSREVATHVIIQLKVSYLHIARADLGVHLLEVKLSGFEKMAKGSLQREGDEASLNARGQ